VHGDFAFLCKLAPNETPRPLCTVLLLLSAIPLAFASAYNARPKLVVVIVIDQFRADYLERYRDQFSDGGFRLFLDRGAYFTDCNYDYANTRTAPDMPPSSPEATPAATASLPTNGGTHRRKSA